MDQVRYQPQAPPHLSGGGRSGRGRGAGLRGRALLGKTAAAACH